MTNTPVASLRYGRRLHRRRTQGRRQGRPGDGVAESAGNRRIDAANRGRQHWADVEFGLKNAMPDALAGNSDAECTIALLYQAGWRVYRDFLETERWLLKATVQSSPFAWHTSFSTSLGYFVTSAP